LARYTDAVCRLCRREGIKLFLKGTKCFSDKCPIEKRNFAPGQHGKDKKTKVVGYGLQLREKQKAKRIYFTQEGQFRNYFENAVRSFKGVTGAKLLERSSAVSTTSSTGSASAFPAARRASWCVTGTCR
jgi:small subunit ribosomal protein S4